MNDEFIEPTKQGKIFLILIFFAGASSLALFQFWIRPLLVDARACEQIPILHTLLIGIHVVTAVAAIVVAFHGFKILKYKQTPLPGAWVWQRTPVKRGRIVTFKAYVLLFASVLLIASLFRSWSMLNPVISEISQKHHCAQRAAAS